MKTEWQVLFVALGGALGAVCRFGISQYFSGVGKSGFPFGTLVANVCGCFLIGMLIGSGTHEKSEAARVGLGIGFLGALTTFSTFGAETIKHANDGQLVHAFGNISANLILGLLAVLIGMAAGKKLFG